MKRIGHLCVRLLLLAILCSPILASAAEAAEPSVEEPLNFLFNLANDLGETKNLAEENPEKAGALRKQLDTILGGVDAQFPKQNSR